MSALSLETTLCVLQAVPATIAIVRAKDQGTKVLCAIIVLLAVVVGLRPYIGISISSNVLTGLVLAMAVLGIIAALRVVNGVLATLLITSGCLLALLVLGIVR
ncbi:MAG: hypothetical protein H0V44_08555 [Planctomycetes bacterium]|nr:hypothetical protein [Planctomycetota bacterium]